MRQPAGPFPTHSSFPTALPHPAPHAPVLAARPICRLLLCLGLQLSAVRHQLLLNLLLRQPEWQRVSAAESEQQRAVEQKSISRTALGTAAEQRGSSRQGSCFRLL